MTPRVRCALAASTHAFFRCGECRHREACTVAMAAATPGWSLTCTQVGWFGSKDAAAWGSWKASRAGRLGCASQVSLGWHGAVAAGAGAPCTAAALLQPSPGSLAVPRSVLVGEVVVAWAAFLASAAAPSAAGAPAALQTVRHPLLWHLHGRPAAARANPWRCSWRRRAVPCLVRSARLRSRSCRGVAP